MIAQRQMRFFVSVVEHQSFAAAARRLGANTRTVRLDIGRLEKAMGITLIERHARGTFPTHEGRALYERLQIPAGLSKRLASETAGAAREAITVGVVDSVLALNADDKARKPARRLPGTRIKYVEYRNAGLLGAVARGEIDSALMYDPEWRPGLSMVPLFEEQMVFVSAARPAVSNIIECSDAIVAALALPGRDDPARIKLQAAAHYLGFAPNVVFELSSHAEIRKLVKRSFAESVMPLGCALREIRANRLSARMIVNPSVTCTLYLVRRNDRPWSVRHEAMLDVVGTATSRLAATMGGLAHPLLEDNVPLARALRIGEEVVAHRPALRFIADSGLGNEASPSEAAGLS